MWCHNSSAKTTLQVNYTRYDLIGRTFTLNNSYKYIYSFHTMKEFLILMWGESYKIETQ